MKGNRNITGDMTEPLWRLHIPLRQESGQTYFPSKVNKREIYKEKSTEADTGRLRISFLRIQVERSSNTNKWLKGVNGVTEADTGRLRISFSRIQVRRSSLQEG